MILVDTNIISEICKPNPNPDVLVWLDRQNSNLLYTSAINKAEILFGLAQLPQGKRREKMLHAFEEIMQLFSGRVLVFDEQAATCYADITFARKRAGRPIQIADAMIAAIAKNHNIAIATRNTKDFDDIGLSLINPFED